MFPEIAAAFPQFRFVMFDYNSFDEAGNATVSSLKKQADILNQEIAQVPEPITLLCHSQGCIVASLAELDRVEKLIFLAPPDVLDIKHFKDIFASREGSAFNTNGTSSIPRSDGTITYLGKDYLDSVAHIDVQALFKNVVARKPVTIVQAADDDIVGQTDFPAVVARIITIPGDHNFTGNAREGLIKTLKTLLD